MTETQITVPATFLEVIAARMEWHSVNDPTGELFELSEDIRKVIRRQKENT